MAVWPKDDTTSAIWLVELITVFLYCVSPIRNSHFRDWFLWTQESHMWSRRNFFFLKNPQRHDFTIAQCQYGESYGLLLIFIWKLRLWRTKRHLRIVCTSIFNEFRATWVNQVKFCNFFNFALFGLCISFISLRYLKNYSRYANFEGGIGKLRSNRCW